MIYTEAQETERRIQLFKDYQGTDEYRKALIQRLQINDACTTKPEARGITWNLCARPDNPAEGCIFFIENFGWTFDPRPQANPNHLPFLLFEYQKDLIKWMIDSIDNGHDSLIEKSRDMGVTWISVWVFLWYWLFKDGVSLLIGSYKEKLVDDRTDDSIFGRIDYAIESLPKWILPRGFSSIKHRTQMKLVNPANQNLIAGDTMNPNFGRGTRKTAIFFDELGSWDYAQDAWEGAAQATACRIANSTPKGFNYYAKLRESGIDVITLHWRRHPLKDEIWYEFEKSRSTEEAIAQELDISYNKSQEGRVYQEWGEPAVEQGFFPYDEGLPMYVGWDFGNSDDTAIIWTQPSNDGLRIVDTYRNSGKTIDFYTPFVTGILPSEGYQYNPKDYKVIEDHKYWSKGTHFGDPAGRFRSAVTNTSVLDVLRQHGIIINFKDEWKEFQKRKTAAKLLIRDGILLNKNERVDYFNMCMSQASYPKIKRDGMDEVQSVKPKHDFSSHYRSAFEYLALGLKEFRNVRRIPFDKFKAKIIGRRVSTTY